MLKRSSRATDPQTDERQVSALARCGKYFIYWKTLNDGSIGIAEILHERMNLGDRLATSASLNSPRDQG